MNVAGLTDTATAHRAMVYNESHFSILCHPHPPMQTINLTDLPPKQCHRDSFRDGAICVLSRSGLHPTERALIRALPSRATGHALVVGNRTGALGLILAADNPDGTIVQHVFDVHHARAIERTLATTPCPRVTVVCTPSMPAEPAPALAVVQITSRDTPQELVLDQLEDLQAVVPAGTTCLVAYDGKPDWLRKQMKTIFGRVSASPEAEGVTLYRAIKQPAPTTGATTCTGHLPTAADRRNFAATFPASLPGDTPIHLTTRPGVFAHRRPDEGGLALAEVAARELQPGARVLDMGCGCGLAALLLAQHAPLADVLAVDSHARAVACTEENARANGLTHVRTLLSDAGVSETGFTVFVGNPPYYSDFQIAELFVRTAHAALAPGGIAYVVAKNHRWHEAFMQELFGNAACIPRRGYGVIKSVRN